MTNVKRFFFPDPCFIIDPYRFRIIKDSWNKTDKRDSILFAQKNAPAPVSMTTCFIADTR